ncbi:MAG: LytTR family DNA-binding domain-containing protein [Verrucomicrobia bacterium]|nr:LytTR family DNA-binding domain-containing protein [Verrucomicrobiota bacterium]
MKLTAIIVDDEPLGRERLRTLLATEADIELLAECANGPAALAAIQARMPDILFLDVQMPEMNGFAVLRALPQPPAVVIFVTAFDEHAVNAFEVHALDYLLKPFKPSRLRQALERARTQLAKQDRDDDPTARLLAMLDARMKPADAESAPPAHVTRFAVRDRDRTRFVKVTDIDWIEASGNYVVIHAGKENFVLRETLAAVEAQVSSKEFFRMNRSALARLDRVKEVEPAFNDEHVVVLATGVRIPLTRGVRELQERLKFA